MSVPAQKISGPAELLIADIPAGDHQHLADLGVIPTEGDAWSQRQRRNTGFFSLFNEMGLECSDSTAVTNVMLSTVGRPATLSDFFLKFVEQLKLLPPIVSSTSRASRVLVINLMPFYLSASRVDKIVRGLYAQHNTGFWQQFSRVVLLCRNIDWFLKSETLQQLRQANLLGCETWAVDVRCFGVRFLSDTTVSNFHITREPFRALLNTSPTRIYNSLVFETNCYIGHFTLKSSHVRTHYDLTEFIRRDDVWEYIFQEFHKLVVGAQKLLVVGAGLEHGAIQRMGEQIKTLLDDEIYVAVETHPAASPSSIVHSGWDSRFDMAVVLGDIVNSGNTLAPWIKELQQGNVRGRPIRAFTIAAMRNSPTFIEGIPVHSVVRIKRDYYPPEPENCRLCQLQQPPKPVKKAEDFRAVLPGQMTPFDFWEMVTEAKALKRNVPDPQGRLFSYRIDTTSVVNRYRAWLRNVAMHKFKITWPHSSPDAICTVDEVSGLAFAQLVAEALQVDRVIKLRRDDLARVTSTGGLPDGLDNPFEKEKHVLVVDDGMNYGRTMRQLIAFCRAADVVPFGGMVLDSRLSDSDTQRIRNWMGGNPIVALYSWPAGSEQL